MNMTKFRPMVLAAVAFGSALVPVASQAAPRAMLEKSASYAIDNEVRAYRVPTLDSVGNVKYFDIVIKLSVGATGTVASTATVVSTPSISVTTMVIPPGTYKASDGTICTVTNITLANGRIQSNIPCKSGTTNWTFSVATGPVSSGHPYLANLVASGIDKRSDVNNQTWGLVTGSTGTGSGTKIGSCDGFAQNQIIGTITNGSQLIVSRFQTQSTARFACSGTLVKQ